MVYSVELSEFQFISCAFVHVQREAQHRYHRTIFSLGSDASHLRNTM